MSAMVPGCALVPAHAHCVAAGVVVQGSGSSDAFVTSFLLHFSDDGTHWHRYRQLTDGHRLQDKVAVV